MGMLYFIWHYSPQRLSNLSSYIGARLQTLACDPQSPKPYPQWTNDYI